MMRFQRSLLPKLLVLLGLVAQSTVVQAQRFEGELLLRPLDGTHMELMQDFSFIDSTGRLWKAPKGYRTDGASIPRALWSVVGSPFTGLYLRAAVVHDVYCYLKSREWKLVHQTFYDAMISGGVTPRQAKVMYYAVLRFGPRWVINANLSCPFGHACYRPTPMKLTVTVFPVVDLQQFSNTKAQIESSNKSLKEIAELADDQLFALASEHELVGKERAVRSGSERQVNRRGNLGSQLRRINELTFR
jgi:hypothetical protein